MSIGETKNLIIRFIPENATNKTVNYKSLNDSIVKVSQDGVIKAMGSGKAKVLVSSIDGKITEDCDILVRQNSNSSENSSIREIELNRDDLILEPGQTLQLKAVTEPANMETQIKWYSKNPTIATVDNNGLVTAISKGETEIVAVSPDGREDEDCDIHVRDSGINSELIPVKKILLDRDDLYLVQGEEVQLKATILPKNASNQEVKWISSNSNVVSVDQNGNITALGQGKAEIKVITLDGFLFEFFNNPADAFGRIISYQQVDVVFVCFHADQTVFIPGTDILNFFFNSVSCSAGQKFFPVFCHKNNMGF